MIYWIVFLALGWFVGFAAMKIVDMASSFIGAFFLFVIIFIPLTLFLVGGISIFVEAVLNLPYRYAGHLGGASLLGMLYAVANSLIKRISSKSKKLAREPT